MKLCSSYICRKTNLFIIKRWIFDEANMVMRLDYIEYKQRINLILTLVLPRYFYNISYQEGGQYDPLQNLFSKMVNCIVWYQCKG